MPYILLLTLGGTIASQFDPDAGGAAPSLHGRALLHGLGVTPRQQVQAESLGQVAGPGVTFSLMEEAARRLASALAEPDCLGAVVTQGTDTLEETAYVLDMLLPRGKPVVITGALRPASAAGADGPANLRDALTVAGSEAAASAGVLVVFDGMIHAARWVRKRHTVSLGAFTSPDWGPVGWVQEDRVQLSAAPPPQPGGNMLARLASLDARVALVTAAVDSDPFLLEACGPDHLDGVVVACLGAGHLPPKWMPVVQRLAPQLPVVCSSRTGAGPLLRSTYAFPGSEQELLAAGCYLSDEPAAQTRVCLTVLLSLRPLPALGDYFTCEVAHGEEPL